jgi:transcriptional regulator with XRE-family HTH domain
MSKSKKAGIGPELGNAISRLRKAYKMSLGDLSEQSGVAKSIISQIERNETNPTISTVQRLSKALDTTVDAVLKADQEKRIVHVPRTAIPKLESEDGLCHLAIIGPVDLVQHVQWYDFHAKPGGVLASQPHQPGSQEHLHVLEGELEVLCGDQSLKAKKGETLRYCGDEPHSITNIGATPVHATMVLIMHPMGN